MLGEENIKALYQFRLLDLFHPSEIALIDFIIQNKRLPTYKDERSKYQILLRLRKKLRKSKEYAFVLTDFFNVVDNLKVSNKLMGGDVR